MRAVTVVGPGLRLRLDSALHASHVLPSDVSKLDPNPAGPNTTLGGGRDALPGIAWCISKPRFLETSRSAVTW